jgi:cystathionine beta-lyase
MTTHSFNFDDIIDRRNTSSLKWDRYGERDILPMWLADMDFRSPPAVIEALRQRVDHGIFGYTLPPEELIETIQANLLRKYNWQIEKHWLVWLPGLVCALNLACLATGGSGDEVVTNVPVYPPFLSAPVNSDRKLITVPLADTDRWDIDFDRLQQAITSRSRLFLFCNPQNPTGRVYNRKELMSVAEYCDQHNLFICSDEIHCDLLLDKELQHIPIASLDPEIAKRTITLMSPSKTYNIPGLGAGFAIISEPALRKSFKRAMNDLVPYINLFGFTATLTAYKHGHDWLEALLQYLRINREIVEKRVAAIQGLSMNHVEATYLAWIDARELDIDNPTRFFETAGVGFGNGADFGTDGFLRLTFGCPRSTLEKALDRIENAVKTEL